MSQVFYRVFRPQKFSEVINQTPIKTTLQNAIASETVAHAYIFTGPRGVGKTTLARILAKALNCERNVNLSPLARGQSPLSSKGESRKVGAAALSSAEPCGKCGNCQAVTTGNFLDLIEIDAASHTGVDNIREIIEHVKFAPSSGKYKVIVIDEAHMLSKGAFNALLKTLEEPPAHAVFVLATTEINKVPATIVSRTQRFDFKKLSQDDIIQQLEKVASASKVKVSAEVLQLVARAADGGMRDALSLFDQLVSFTGGKITLESAEDILGLAPFAESQDFIGLILESKTAECIAVLKELSRSGRDMTLFTNSILNYLDLMLGQKLKGEEASVELGLGKEDAEKMNRQLEKITACEISVLLGLFMTAFQKIKFSPIPELPLEIAVVEYLENQGRDDDKPQTPQGPSARVPMSARPTNRLEQPTGAKPTEPSAERPKPRKSTVDDPKLVNSRWSEFLNVVKEYNNSLLTSLRLAKLVGVKDGEIILSFPYRFHKEAVEQRKNKIVIEKAMEEVYGGHYKLRCMLTHEVDDSVFESEPKKDEPEPEVKPGLLDEAMKVFGAAGE